MKGLILTTDGFEDSEFNYPYYRLREAGIEVDVATPGAKSVAGKHGYEFEADVAIEEHDPEWWASEYDFVVVPGGDAPESLRTEAPTAAAIVAAFDDASKPIASICHGVQLLISADILDGRRVTGYWPLEADVENAGATFVDESVVVDGTLVSSRVPDDLPGFTLELLAQLDGITADAGRMQPTPTV